jgi:hypothetical protein
VSVRSGEIPWLLVTQPPGPDPVPVYGTGDAETSDVTQVFHRSAGDRRERFPADGSLATAISYRVRTWLLAERVGSKVTTVAPVRVLTGRVRPAASRRPI